MVLGGWATGVRPDPSRARWFSVELCPAAAPWAYTKGPSPGEPFRAIASLELLAVLVGMMVFLSKVSEADFRGSGTVGFAVGADNQGNGSLLAKKLTTKFPLCVILMEVCAQLERRKVDLDLRWRPCEGNHEADELTNEDCSLFDPARRIVVALDQLDFIHMQRPFDEGAQYLAELERARGQKRTLELRPRARRKRRPAQTFRAKDPW